MKTLVILPSYNESLNIGELIQSILDGNADHDVCVVDDSSPDGTAACIEQGQGARPGWGERVKLIVRAEKGGRGGAVRAGLEWGARQGRYRAFVEMDCDFSHEPAAIEEGLSLLEQGYDVVIGARYPNGTILGWPKTRRALSFCANLLARSLIDWDIADYTNGFRFYTPEAVAELLRHEQQHKGHIYLTETLSHLLRSGRRVGSFPIVFRNRERGVSNTSTSEILSSLKGVLAIARQHRMNRR